MEVIYPRCAGLDVHKQTVVACVRIAGDGPPLQEVRTFATTTSGLLTLADWLDSFGVEHVGMEATGVYWKPVWHVLEGHFELVLANAAHVKNVPGRKTDVNDAMWLALTRPMQEIRRSGSSWPSMMACSTARALLPKMSLSTPLSLRLASSSTFSMRWA